MVETTESFDLRAETNIGVWDIGVERLLDVLVAAVRAVERAGAHAALADYLDELRGNEDFTVESAAPGLLLALRGCSGSGNLGAGTSQRTLRHGGTLPSAPVVGYLRLCYAPIVYFLGKVATPKVHFEHINASLILALMRGISDVVKSKVLNGFCERQRA